MPISASSPTGSLARRSIRPTVSHARWCVGTSLPCRLATTPVAASPARSPHCGATSPGRSRRGSRTSIRPSASRSPPGRAVCRGVLDRRELEQLLDGPTSRRRTRVASAPRRRGTRGPLRVRRPGVRALRTRSRPGSARRGCADRVGQRGKGTPSAARRTGGRRLPGMVRRFAATSFPTPPGRSSSRTSVASS